jgi:prepilin-type N-terminal cleavage/methylation domain-containing protein
MKQIRKFNRAAAKLGFTLIELSIVLVIIGLIVGGILVGQDLIKAAEIRATVSQLEKYSTAVNVFRSKYNGIPGDVLNAGNFGFDATRAGTAGNGVIESSAANSGTFAGESSCFWDDLTFAGMINETLNQPDSNACGQGQTPTAAIPIASMLPPAKLGGGNLIHVGSTGGVNYFAITGVTAISAGLMTPTDSLSPSAAFQIDSKIDDGLPLAGSVQTTISEAAQVEGEVSETAIFATLDAAGADAEGRCVFTGGIYNFGPLVGNGNGQACQLRVRASF